MRTNLKISTFIALVAIAIILLPILGLSASNACITHGTSTNSATNGCGICNCSISGIKFNDLDRNGVKGSGESGVEGVEIRLYNAATGALIDSDVTDSYGKYAFTGLRTGSYIVREVLPSGYVNTTPSIVQVTLNSVRTATVNFGNYKKCPTATPTCKPTVTPTITPTCTVTPSPGTGRVTGVVFVDINEDGTLDPTDPRVSGVTVRIASIYGLVLDEDVTDTNGYYEFTGLSPASYRVFITVPDGYFNTTPTSVTIALSSGQTRQVNFGLFYDEPVEDALIKGLVFYDTDENGQYDPSDSRIADVTVSLYSSGNSLLGTRVTNDQGYYEFADLTPGTYSVRVTVPSGYVATTSTSVQVTLASGETGQVPFGLIFSDDSSAPIGTGSIRGICYIDENGNDAFDEGDQRVEGIGIMLRDSGGLVGGMQTNSQGFFKFEGLAAGNYVVSTELPDAYVAGSNHISVSLATGETAGVSFSILSDG